MDILKYISEQSLILIPVVYIIGVFLKTNKRIPDWIIPWVLLVINIGFSIGLLGFTVQAVIQGVLVVGLAVLGNQLFKQTIEGIKGEQPQTPKEIYPKGSYTEYRE
jgi:hypothetical protein